MRRKVNNSETHETKRYYEVPSEKVQEWSDTIENLAKQRDQYKTERDTLIDDLSWYKAKVSRLEQIRDIKDSALKGADIKVKTLERESKQKSIILNLLDKENERNKSLLSEISQHIGNKPASSTYKYFRAKLDNLNITEDK